jgi:hypothetical protein
VTNTRKLIKDVVIMETTEMVYRSLQGRLTSALILKSLHAGLKYQKCREIVFNAMLKEDTDLSDLSRTLRSTEQDIVSNRLPHNTWRNSNGNGKATTRSHKINGMSAEQNEQEVNNEVSAEEEPRPDGAAPATMADIQSMKTALSEEIVAALKQNKTDVKKKKFKGKCGFCDIIGHKEAECRKKKAQAASTKKSEN